MQNKSVLNFIEVDSKTLWSEVLPHFQQVYANRFENDGSKYLQEIEKQRISLLGKRTENLFGLYILAKKDDELVGWHAGEQESVDGYYMRNSAILEKFRGQGYYEEMLSFLIERVSQEGFQVLTSRHHPNNPAILIPKLRKGFITTSTEMSDCFGFLVTLKYFVNKKRRKDFGKRIGLEL